MTFAEQDFSSQLPYIEEFAKLWLESGANSYELWTDSTRLAGWSKNGTTDQNFLTAEIKFDSTLIGEIRLSGLVSQTAASRLNAEARLISSHASLERDLYGLAGELIDTRDQLLAIFNLTKANHTNRDLEPLLDEVTFKAARLLNAEGAFLNLEMLDGTKYLHQFPLPLLSEQQKDELVNRFMEEDNHYLYINEDESELSEAVHNLLLVPIPVHEASQAVLGIINKAGGPYLTPDIKMAKAIADFSGAQIENLLLFQVRIEQAKLQEEMELAQEVQLRFLPANTPKNPYLEVWAAARPASHVGGDFYDFSPDLDDVFVFFIGDVSGKGMPAALLVAMTQTTLRTELNSINEHSPHQILDSSNRKLYEDFNKVGMFATAFIGRYDSRTHQLCYGNAGHSPVVYTPAGDESYLLKADSMPIGIMSTRDSEDQCLVFRKGDVVVIGTDGLVDALNMDNERFGYDRFRKQVEILAHKTSQEIGEGLFSALDEFADGKYQVDDQTLVVLKRIN